jgi:hypothetical protein
MKNLVGNCKLPGPDATADDNFGLQQKSIFRKSEISSEKLKCEANDY